MSEGSMVELLVFSKSERKLLAKILNEEWLKRNIGMCTCDEVKEKPLLESLIRKLGRAFEEGKLLKER